MNHATSLFARLKTLNLKLHLATTAAALHKLHSGGITGAIRCKCANSAPRSLTSADTKCQFSGHTGASRPPFRRKYCKLCETCSNNCNI